MSTFNAMIVSVSRRFHNGLFFGGNYMLSHALDDGSVVQETRIRQRTTLAPDVNTGTVISIRGTVGQ
jgi:hypothetical protein